MSDAAIVSPAGQNSSLRWQRGWRSFITALSALFMLYIVIYVLDILPTFFGLGISGPFHEGMFVGIVLFVAFIILPAKGGSEDRTRNTIPPWYDIVLAILSLIPTLYYAFFFETWLIELQYTVPIINIILGWLLILLVWEASRRSLGLVFAIIIAVALAYLLFGSYLPGFFQTDLYSFGKVGNFMFTSRDGIIGVPVSTASKIIVTFLLFAQMLYITGAGDWFVNIANSLTGHVRGGPAKASVVGSGLLGMISASPAANTATIGMVTIPMMKKTGFSATFAAGVEAVASTGGQIMPPVMGAIAFIICEYVNMPYGQVIIYAFIPAVLYYLALFIQVDLNAKKNGIMGLPRAELPRFWQTAKQGYLFLIPLVALLFCMIVLTYSAEKSAIYAIVSLIIISWLSRKKEEKIGFGKLVNGADGAMRGLISVAVACAGCGIIIGALSLSLLSYKLTFQLMSMVGGTLLPVLCLAAIICYIMGMGVSPLVSYLTLALMVAPAVIKMGVPPLAIHLFIMYWAITAFITPPFAVAAFVAAGIAKCSLWGAGFQAMRLGIGTYLVPFIFVYNPGLLLLDTPQAIVMAVITAIVGITCLSIGVEGHLFKDLNWPQRLLFMAGGIVLSISSGFEQIYAVVAILIALAWHWISTKAIKSSASTKKVETLF